MLSVNQKKIADLAHLQPEHILQASLNLDSNVSRQIMSSSKIKSSTSRGITAERLRSSTAQQMSSKKSKDDILLPKQIRMYENLFNGFILVDEVTEQQSEQIRIYSNDEMSKLITDKMIDKVRPSDLQATIWSQNFSFKTRKQLWLHAAQVDKLKEQFKHFSYIDNKKASKQQQDQEQIYKDLHRTYNQEDGIKEITSMISMLRNVLIAYSNFDPIVGYTQGMNFLVGNLLVLMSLDDHIDSSFQDFCVLDNSQEEEVFWILVFIMFNKDWRQMYLQDTPGIYEGISQLEVRLKQVAPQILLHFQELGIDSLAMLLASYYLSLLTHNTPVLLTEIIVSLFLLDGIQFFNQLIIAALQQVETQILSLNDLGEIMNYFRKDLFTDFENSRTLIISNNILIQTLQRLELLSDINYCQGQVLTIQEYSEQDVQRSPTQFNLNGIKNKIDPKKIGGKIKRMLSWSKK